MQPVTGHGTHTAHGDDLVCDSAHTARCTSDLGPRMVGTHRTQRTALLVTISAATSSELTIVHLALDGGWLTSIEVRYLGGGRQLRTKPRLPGTWQKAHHRVSRSSTTPCLMPSDLCSLQVACTMQCKVRMQARCMLPPPTAHPESNLRTPCAFVPPCVVPTPHSPRALRAAPPSSPARCPLSAGHLAWRRPCAWPSCAPQT